MNITQNLIIGIIVLLITVLISLRKDFSKKIIVLIFGMTSAIAILIFPFYSEYDLLTQLFSSVLYAVQTIILNEDFELINSLNISSIVNVIYIGLMYLLFLLQPLATATMVLSLLSDNVLKIKVLFLRYKSAIIFSDINEKTITIAKQQDTKKNLIIFITEDKEEKKYLVKESNIQAIILKGNVINTKIPNKNIVYYLYSKEDENLTNALSIIENKDNGKNIKIYILNNNKEARTILDSCDNRGIKIELVNEIDRAIYQLLYEEPIYKESKNNVLSILIVGCGQIGMEFLKAVTWCGQLINHKLYINVIDIKATEKLEKLSIECPELLKNYNYNFIDADIYSQKAMKELDKLKKQNINYVLVSLENDSKNIDVSIMLRKYFLRQDTNNYKNKPIINLWVENDIKKSQIDKLKHDSVVNSYSLNAFGNIKSLYGKNSIVNSDIEELAKQVHGIYMPDDIKNGMINFYKMEYNKKSSRAVAIHLKYKLYSILKDSYIGNLEEDLENNLTEVFKQYNQLAQNSTVIDKLVKNEHERWNAYMRTDGFINVPVEEVSKYINDTKSCKHFLAKLHPSIVEFDEIEHVSKKLNTNFIKSDINIINNIENILTKQIYKDE